MKKSSKKSHSLITDYLGRIYDIKKYPNTINKLATKIKNFKLKQPFDAIAFTGTSGAAVAYPLSFLLGIPLICIRKDKRSHYGNGLYEGICGIEGYIIVDDFFASGKTIKRVIKEIKSEAIFRRSISPKPVGIFLYNAGHIKDRTFDQQKIPIIKVR